MEDFEKQKKELQELKFHPLTADLTLGNRPRSLAKCMTCRALIEVPMVYAEGAGSDARAHRSWHKKMET